MFKLNPDEFYEFRHRYIDQMATVDHGDEDTQEVLNVQVRTLALIWFSLKDAACKCCFACYNSIESL